MCKSGFVSVRSSTISALEPRPPDLLNQWNKSSLKILFHNQNTFLPCQAVYFFQCDNDAWCRARENFLQIKWHKGTSCVLWQKLGLRKFCHLNSFLQQLLSVWTQSKSNVIEILDSILDDRHLRVNNKNPTLDRSCCKWKATMAVFMARWKCRFWYRMMCFSVELSSALTIHCVHTILLKLIKCTI